jgi:hypothetical protein
MRWFTGEGDGRLAESDDVDGHVRALEAELAAWSDGRRSTDEISRRWVERLHAPAVVGKILAMKGARAEETRDA